MDASLAEWLPALALAIALAACAGLRAFLPLLLAGGLARLGWLELGPAFAFLASTKALVIFGVATVVEVAGDKIPAVDHTLDALATPLRLGAGALLAAAAFGQVSDPLTASVLGVAVGTPVALVPHAAKSVLRLFTTGATAGLLNPVLSLLEDVLTLVLFVLAVLLPLAVVALLALVLLFIARRRPRTPVPRPA
jgi:uncharacterized membrane protein